MNLSLLPFLVSSSYKHVLILFYATKKKIRHQPWLYNVIGKEKDFFLFFFLFRFHSECIVIVVMLRFFYSPFSLSPSLYFFSSPSPRHSSHIDDGEGKEKRKT